MMPTFTASNHAESQHVALHTSHEPRARKSASKTCLNATTHDLNGPEDGSCRMRLLNHTPHVRQEGNPTPRGAGVVSNRLLPITTSIRV